MGDGADDLFVIDKQGAEETQSNTILYDFQPEEANDEPDTKAKPIRQRWKPSGKRYHEADDFQKFRPGVLSRELRKALDLARHEVPIHVYRMRTLGYPPGWLRKAKVGGDLAIFDSVSALAEDAEITYNRDALISYPGFNTELHYPYVDQSQQLHCPPMQSHHMLDNFYAALSRNSRWNSHNKALNVSHDLGKLHEERERILAEIRQLDSKLSLSQNTAESAVITSDVKDNLTFPDSAFNDCGSQNSTKCSSELNGDLSQSHQDPDTSDPSAQILLISASEEGTPTPQGLYCSEDNIGDNRSSSGLIKRPSIDAFTVGVQPFRPFENLPGSRGGYQRVLKTLRHIRVESSRVSDSPSSNNMRSSIASSNRVHSSTPYGNRVGRHPDVDFTHSSSGFHSRHNFSRQYDHRC